jgi:hypothetical protein
MGSSNYIPVEIHSREMSIEEFKKFLGPALAAKYTDVQLVCLQTEMREMAALLLEVWLEKAGGRRERRRSLNWKTERRHHEERRFGLGPSDT